MVVVRVALSEQENGRRDNSSGKSWKRISRAGIAACVVALLLVTAHPAYSASPNVGTILRKVGSVYSHLQNYHIVALLDNSLQKPDRISTHHSLITMDVAGRGRVRMALRGDGLDVLVVSDGKTAWHYVVNENEYTEREASAVLETPGTREQGARTSPSDLLGQVQDLLIDRLVRLWQVQKAATFMGNDTVEFQGKETPCYRIVFHLKGLTDELWIDQLKFQVLQESLIHPQGTASPRSYVVETVRIKEIETHASHSAGFFTFTPPAGARRVAALHLPGIQEGLVGSPAGDFTLPDIKGKQVSLSDFRGKTVLLVFWATWCPPCQKELPTIEKIYQQHQDRDVVVLAVDDESEAKITKFLKERHYDFTVLIDHKRTLFRKFAVHFVPTVYVINAEGIVVRETVGWERPQKLLTALGVGER